MKAASHAAVFSIKTAFPITTNNHYNTFNLSFYSEFKGEFMGDDDLLDCQSSRVTAQAGFPSNQVESRLDRDIFTIYPSIHHPSIYVYVCAFYPSFNNCRSGVQNALHLPQSRNHKQVTSHHCRHWVTLEADTASLSRLCY